MSEEPPRKRRGGPPEGERAMTNAERQRKARFKRKHSPRRDNILVAIAQVQALNWTITRMEEIAAEMEEGDRRARLDKHCANLRAAWKQVLTSLKKADRPEP